MKPDRKAGFMLLLTGCVFAASLPEYGIPIGAIGHQNKQLDVCSVPVVLKETLTCVCNPHAQPVPNLLVCNMKMFDIDCLQT